MQSMEPARSSTVAIAQALPCLVILRWRPEMMPPMVTMAPSGRSARSATAQSALSASTCSMPCSGCEETYRPSISRSWVSRKDFSHSSSENTTSRPKLGSSETLSPPKRSNWPSASLRLMLTTLSIIGSNWAVRPLRVWPRESKAPALMRDSTVRLLQTTASTLSRKSGNEAYFPLALRVRIIDSTTGPPTLRIAVSPNRTVSLPCGVKSASDSLTSGGSTWMPILRHSLR